MEEIPNSAPNEALIKAEAPKLVSLLEEMKNGLNFLTQEPRFLRESDIGSMFGNMNNSPGMSSANPFVRNANILKNAWIEKVSPTLLKLDVSMLNPDSSGVWEPTTLLLNRDGYLVKSNHKPGAQDEAG
ncbi:hypothetical protein QJS10_CPA01g00140 [Acorus calamus]|uniref:Uncharacterized protein n=1 Tax=Acorus calamus TaxID=4465 RepID=A0AAV9FPR0_ACOCL|nr:hypothetical protein QJS10_CPA01g00140 [Acorus calamus]